MATNALIRAFTLAILMLMFTSPFVSAASAASLFSRKSYNAKPIRFRIQNAADQPVSLHAGSQQFSVQAHSIITAQIPIGDQLVMDTSLPKLPAGSLVVIVHKGLTNGTVILH